LKKIYFNIVGFFVLCSIKAFAGYHAASIVYTHVSGYTYQITLTTVTDSASGIHCQETLEAGAGTPSLILNRMNGPTTHCFPNHDGLVVGALSYNEYVGNMTFPGPGNYNIVFNGINRNSGIINMASSDAQSLFIQTEIIISSFSGPNTAPVFTNAIIEDFSCLNTGCYYYNPSAFDADGDSLVFSLLPCQSSASVAAGYSFPSGTFSINPTSGIINWCSPQIAGMYNVLLKTEEWRKNIDGTSLIIGYTEKDLQFNITNCTSIHDFETSTSILISPNPTTNSTQINFLNKTNESYTFELVDITGKQIDCEISESNHIALNSFTLHLDNVVSGMYFLKIMGNKETNLTKKIIKN